MVLKSEWKYETFSSFSFFLCRSQEPTFPYSSTWKRQVKHNLYLTALARGCCMTASSTCVDISGWSCSMTSVPRCDIKQHSGAYLALLCQLMDNTDVAVCRKNELWLPSVEDSRISYILRIATSTDDQTLRQKIDHLFSTYSLQLSTGETSVYYQIQVWPDISLSEI